MNKKQREKIWKEIPLAVKEAICDNFNLNINKISNQRLHNKINPNHEYFAAFIFGTGENYLYSYKDKNNLMELCQGLLQENEIPYILFDREGNEVEIKIKEIEVEKI